MGAARRDDGSGFLVNVSRGLSSLGSPDAVRAEAARLAAAIERAAERPRESVQSAFNLSASARTAELAERCSRAARCGSAASR